MKFIADRDKFTKNANVASKQNNNNMCGITKKNSNWHYSIVFLPHSCLLHATFAFSMLVVPQLRYNSLQMRLLLISVVWWSLLFVIVVELLIIYIFFLIIRILFMDLLKLFNIATKWRKMLSFLPQRLQSALLFVVVVFVFSNCYCVVFVRIFSPVLRYFFVCCCRCENRATFLCRSRQCGVLQAI